MAEYTGKYISVYNPEIEFETDYIAREAARDLIYHKQGPLTEYDLNDLPPADVRPVVPGRWINEERVGFGSVEAECSNCGRRMIFNNAWRCCPWCMADMRSGDAKIQQCKKPKEDKI